MTLQFSSEKSNWEFLKVTLQTSLNLQKWHVLHLKLFTVLIKLYISEPISVSYSLQFAASRLRQTVFLNFI